MAFGLRTASSDKVVSRLPVPERLGYSCGLDLEPSRGELASLFDGAPAGRTSTVVRIGPSGDRLGVLVSAADMLWTPKRRSRTRRGSRAWRRHTRSPQRPPAGSKERDTPSHRCPRTGRRHARVTASWSGPCRRLMRRSSVCVAAVVLDAHDEAYHAEAAPTWCAWEVVAERARRDGAPLALVSPCPTLDVLRAGRLVVTDRVSERRAWPTRRSGRSQGGRPSYGTVLRARRQAREMGGRGADRIAGCRSEESGSAWHAELSACSTRRAAHDCSLAGHARHSRVANVAGGALPVSVATRRSTQGAHLPPMWSRASVHLCGVRVCAPDTSCAKE